MPAAYILYFTGVILTAVGATLLGWNASAEAWMLLGPTKGKNRNQKMGLTLKSSVGLRSNPLEAQFKLI